MMHDLLHFYDLTQDPFAPVAQSAALFVAPSHSQLISQLLADLTAGPGVVTLRGDAGVGKTSVSRLLAAALRRHRVLPVELVGGQHNAPQMQALIAQAAGLGGGAEGLSPDELARELPARVGPGGLTLVMDDAHRLADIDYRYLVLLRASLSFTKVGFGLILVGNPGRWPALELPDLQALQPASMARHVVFPLRADEAEEFLEHKFNLAGRQIHHVLSASALAAVVQEADGVPGRLEALTAASLGHAYAKRRRRVTLRSVLPTLSPEKGNAAPLVLKSLQRPAIAFGSVLLAGTVLAGGYLWRDELGLTSAGLPFLSAAGSTSAALSSPEPPSPGPAATAPPAGSPPVLAQLTPPPAAVPPPTVAPPEAAAIDRPRPTAPVEPLPPPREHEKLAKAAPTKPAPPLDLAPGAVQATPPVASASLPPPAQPATQMASLAAGGSNGANLDHTAPAHAAAPQTTPAPPTPAPPQAEALSPAAEQSLTASAASPEPPPSRGPAPPLAASPPVMAQFGSQAAQPAPTAPPEPASPPETVAQANPPPPASSPPAPAATPSPTASGKPAALPAAPDKPGPRATQLAPPPAPVYATPLPLPPPQTPQPAPPAAKPEGPTSLASNPTPPPAKPPAAPEAPQQPEHAPAVLASVPEPTVLPVPPANPADALRREKQRGSPGLILMAGPSDTLPKLYERVYRGVKPPPYAAVLAANHEPVQSGELLIFPEPPNGWSKGDKPREVSADPLGLAIRQAVERHRWSRYGRRDTRR